MVKTNEAELWQALSAVMDEVKEIPYHTPEEKAEWNELRGLLPPEPEWDQEGFWADVAIRAPRVAALQAEIDEVSELRRVLGLKARVLEFIVAVIKQIDREPGAELLAFIDNAKGERRRLDSRYYDLKEKQDRLKGAGTKFCRVLDEWNERRHQEQADWRNLQSEILDLVFKKMQARRRAALEDVVQRASEILNQLLGVSHAGESESEGA